MSFDHNSFLVFTGHVLSPNVTSDIFRSSSSRSIFGGTLPTPARTGVTGSCRPPSPLPLQNKKLIQPSLTYCGGCRSRTSQYVGGAQTGGSWTDARASGRSLVFAPSAPPWIDGRAGGPSLARLFPPRPPRTSRLPVGPSKRTNC